MLIDPGSRDLSVRVRLEEISVAFEERVQVKVEQVLGMSRK